MLVELLLIVASVLHAAFAAYFLYRNVERMTRWEVTLMRATLEQLRVCALGLLLAFGLIAAVSATARLRDETFAVLVFGVFLVSWIFGQAQLIPRLVTGSTFIAPWTFRQIWFGTVTAVVISDVLLGVAILGAVRFLK